MKTTKFLSLLAAGLLLTACSKDDKNTNDSFTTEDARTNAQIDAIADDVSSIAETEYTNQASASGKTTQTQTTSTLPTCAAVTTEWTPTAWTSTINFGTGCELANGNTISGIIVVSGSVDFAQQAYVVNYSFQNFYHNNRHVEGDRKITYTWQSTAAQAEAHTVANVEMNFTVTYPNGNVYTRSGNRVRELVQGYNTPLNWLDNIYEITGTWTTTFPAGTQTSEVTVPLQIPVTCGRIVSGELTITRNNNIGVINYGDGQCDALATVAINGGSPIQVSF